MNRKYYTTEKELDRLKEFREQFKIMEEELELVGCLPEKAEKDMKEMIASLKYIIEDIEGQEIAE